MFSQEQRALLHDTFEPDSSGGRFGLTEHGIWHPTPLAVLLPALEKIAEQGWLGSTARSLTILDAGSGDGRVVGALGVLSGLSTKTRVLGLEANARLDSLAREHLDRVRPARPTELGRGDFLERASYDALGIGPSDVDVFMTYPDGAEKALGPFIVREAPSAMLIALSPDRNLGVPRLEQRGALELTRRGSPGWCARRFAPP